MDKSKSTKLLILLWDTSILHFPIDDLTLAGEWWPLTSPDRTRRSEWSKISQSETWTGSHWPIRGHYRGHVSVWVTVMGWLILSIKVKGGLWPEYRDCATHHTAWPCLITASRHKLSLSVSQQLFLTRWRQRGSQLGEVARQINSKYKYLAAFQTTKK